MREKLKQINTTKGWLWCAMAISFLLNIMFIGESYMIFLSTDEQGPMAVAALINGVDWSDTTRNLPYYSYGYALILAPIFWLTNSARAMYWGAIIVNALMATAIVPLAYSIGRRLNKELSEKLMVAIAFCLGHYSCIIVRSHLALCEMTLIFLMWMMTWLCFSIEDKAKSWKYALLAVLLMYSYTIHQRMLAVVIAGGVALAVYLFKQFTVKREGKEVLKKLIFYTGIALILAVIIYFLHSELKAAITEVLWSGGEREHINTPEDMKGRILRYLNWSGVKTLVKAICGHLYYMGVATLLFGFIGLFCLFKVNWANLLALFSKKRELSAYPMSKLFILGSFVVSLAVSVFYIGGGTGRADYLVYGRYVEQTFGPILLIALVYLLSKKEKPMVFSVLSVLGLIICTLITDYAYGNVRYVEFMGVNCIGINIFRYDGYVHVYTGMVVALLSFALAYVVFRKMNIKAHMIILTIIAVYWTYCGINLLWNVILPAEKCTYEYSWLLDARDEGTEDWPVYYTGPSGLTYEAPFIQYLLKDDTLHYIDTADIHSLRGTSHYAINRHSPIEMQEGYTLKGCSNEVFVYKYDGSEMDNVIELPIEMFQTLTGTFTERGLVNAEPGVLMYGPYLTLIAGSYHIEVRYEMMSEGGDGYFDVATGEVTHAVCHFSESTRDENGVYTANLDFSVIETWGREEIRCFVKAGQYRILGATLTYTRDMIDVPLSIYTTELGVEDENGVVNTAPGRLFAGPYNDWYFGDYEILIDYEVLSDDLAGHFAILEDGTVLDRMEIDRSKGQAVLKLSVENNTRRRKMDLACEITSGQIRITNVTILREMEE